MYTYLVTRLNNTLIVLFFSTARKRLCYLTTFVFQVVYLTWSSARMGKFCPRPVSGETFSSLIPWPAASYRTWRTLTRTASTASGTRWRGGRGDLYLGILAVRGTGTMGLLAWIGGRRWCVVYFQESGEGYQNTVHMPIVRSGVLG